MYGLRAQTGLYTRLNRLGSDPQSTSLRSATLGKASLRLTFLVCETVPLIASIS